MNAQLVSTPTYHTREGDVTGDREAVLALWRGNLGDDARMRDKYAWFYQQSDAGPPLLKLLVYDGQAVGVCSAGRRRLLLDGQPLRAGVLVDLAVLPEHRSLGPALILQQDMVAAARRDFDLLYGFPNARAAPVFRRVGYRVLGELARYVRVLRPGRYLARNMPAVLARPAGLLIDLGVRALEALRSLGTVRLDTVWQDHADERMQSLWQHSTRPDGVVAVRDLAHLSWRFDRAPGAGFRYLLLEDPRKPGLCAWFATRVQHGTLHVHDYWSLHGPALGTTHIAALLRAARADGHAAVSIELCTEASHLLPWRALGFVERGKRPIFGFWSAQTTAEMTVPLHFTAADEDE
jgi:hypothetical protein